MKQKLIINEKELKRIIKHVVNEMGIPESEEIPAYDVFNDNFDGDWKSVLTANLYDSNNKCVGTLRDLHFLYIPEIGGFEGSW